VIRHAALTMFLAVLAVPVAAQTGDQASSTRRIEFLPRVLFQMGAEHLSGEDQRFIWDANFGGEIDLLDYGVGRGTFVASYQVLLGDELRKFDPNQGNYILEGSASRRFPGVEVAGVFYHQSRHLSDRPKEQAIDWNMLGGRIRGDGTVGTAHLDARADVRGVLKKSFVDYRWEIDARLRSNVPIRPRVGVIAGAGVRVIGVDGSAGRGTQTGFRAEGGVRIDGPAGAVELFLAGERRIDPYQLEFGTATWSTFGFRLLSR
jgi:hypothetical protein